MPILTASQDYLRFDPLKAGDMDGVDLLDKTASKRIKTYDKNLGYAVHPEERAADLLYKRSVDSAAKEQQSGLSDYKSSFSSAMSDADKEAAGILGGIKGGSVPGQDTVTVNVVGYDDSVKTYRINKKWADSFIPSQPGAKSTSSGVYTVQGYTEDRFDGNMEVRRNPSADIYNTLAEAQSQTLGVDSDITGMNSDISKAVGDAKTSAQMQIDSQRGIATDSYNQQVSQANQGIEQTKALWTNYQNSQRKAFATGIATNTGGIRDLVESGALVMKGSVK